MIKIDSGPKCTLLLILIIYLVGCKTNIKFKDSGIIYQSELWKSINNSIIKFEMQNEEIDKNLAYFLDSIILNHKIIILGEPSHYSSTSYKIKNQIIRYLYENHDFNVLLLEGDFFGLNSITDFYLNQSYRQKEVNQDSICYNLGLPIFWQSCIGFNSLFNNYIPATYNTPNPLILNGFDPQFYSLYSSLHFKNYIRFIYSNNISNQTKDSTINHLIDKNPWLELTKDEIEYLIPKFIKLKEQIEFNNKNFSEEYYNILNYICILQYLNINMNEKNKLREEQMALNLDYLLNSKFKNKKIIISAHDIHVVRYSDSLYKDYQSLVNIITRDSNLNNQIYTIGITGRSGYFGGLDKDIFAIPEHPDGFEVNIQDSFNYGILDNSRINEENRTIRFFAGFENFIPTWGQWLKHYDAIIYIKSMIDCNEN